MIICGLLHDLCKINFYVEDKEMATGPQLNFLKDLVSKSSSTEVVPHSDRLTKQYASKLIEYYKGGEVGEYPTYSTSYAVKDTFPMGHGEKSVYLISKFIDLTDAEALAIRWHLGPFDPGFHAGYPSGMPCQQAVREHPLVRMLFAADYLATWMVDIQV
jgi:hypothetical protein